MTSEEIEFKEIKGKPDDETLKEIKAFYASIFEVTNSQKFEKRIAESESLLTILARHNGEIVGFKIGYQTEPKKFYSWVGGVDERFRENGIAAQLMKRQHEWCERNGYDVVRTKTKNSFKSMLILNLKSGFDIVDVYTDKQDEKKIILEKELNKNPLKKSKNPAKS